MDGRAVAWNLVEGVNDPPAGSERTVWVDGVAQEAGPVRFAADLGAVLPRDGGHAGLRFTPRRPAPATRTGCSCAAAIEQPFGHFTGEPAPGLRARRGLGVMEAHDVHW